jgi:hypothetical protein
MAQHLLTDERIAQRRRIAEPTGDVEGLSTERVTAVAVG